MERTAERVLLNLRPPLWGIDAPVRMSPMAVTVCVSITLQLKSTAIAVWLHRNKPQQHAKDNWTPDVTHGTSTGGLWRAGQWSSGTKPTTEAEGRRTRV